MRTPSRGPERLLGYIYPGPASSRTELMVVIAWSGIIGIVMLIGVVIDDGLVGRIGSVVVLCGLVLPLWVRALRQLASDRR